VLAGLEHLDERYLKAVGYATKSKRALAARPAEDGADRRHRRRRRGRVARATSRGGAHRQRRSGEGFVAVGADARKKFWLDRARTAAIARHTNAFKINEDVVIPLPRMGEYTDGIERINIELSPAQQARAARRAECLVRADVAALPLGRSDDADEIPAPSCSATGCSARVRCWRT
jgi:FAD/FMN-containing dehydrogenase